MNTKGAKVLLDRVNSSRFRVVFQILLGASLLVGFFVGFFLLGWLAGTLLQTLGVKTLFFLPAPDLGDDNKWALTILIGYAWLLPFAAIGRFCWMIGASLTEGADSQ